MAKNAKGVAKPATVKLKISRAIPVGAQIPCVDNSGAKLLNVISVYFIGSRLNRLPSATLGDMMLVSVRQGKPELKKKVMPSVLLRQRKMWRRFNGVSVYCEDNGSCIITPRGDVKGSAITGPITKECSELWPPLATRASAVL